MHRWIHDMIDAKFKVVQVYAYMYSERVISYAFHLLSHHVRHELILRVASGSVERQGLTTRGMGESSQSSKPKVHPEAFMRGL